MRYFVYRWEEPISDELAAWGASTAYWEVGSDGYFTRSLAVFDGGQALSYDEAHEADTFGILPEGTLIPEELEPEDRASLQEISREQFEKVWARTVVLNRGA